jgi:hypothetical protein
MFGDHNIRVVDSTTKLYTKLHKGHILLSNHYVREAITFKMKSFTHIPGSEKPADILSKHWGYSYVWEHLKCLLFWQGDTLDIV